MAPKKRTAAEQALTKSKATNARRKKKRQEKGRARAAEAAAGSSTSESLQTQVYKQAVQTGRKAKGLFAVCRSLRIAAEIDAIDRAEPPSQASSSGSNAAHTAAQVTEVALAAQAAEVAAGAKAQAVAHGQRQEARLASLLEALPKEESPSVTDELGAAWRLPAQQVNLRTDRTV